MKFTKSQQLAIDTLDKNLTVSAGAGSGKTTVLVNRYLHMLESKKANLSEILAITFTKKAARDMRRRVREHINNKQLTNFSDEKYWRNLKNQFNTATITTIHSFGFKVLRAHPVESKMSPEVKLLDEIQSLLLLKEITGAVLANAATKTAMIKELITSLRSGEAAIETLVNIYLRTRALGGDPEDVASLALDYKNEAYDLLNKTRDQLCCALVDLVKAAQASNGKSKFVSKWKDAPLDDWLDTLSTAKSLNEYGVYQTIEAIRSACSRPAKAFAEQTKEISYKSEGTGLIYVFEDILAFFDALPMWQEVSELIKEVHHQYSKAKKVQRVVDYSDLEWGLLDLLQNNEGVRNYYQNKYKYVMVDEFQDTSPLQQRLIKLLAPYSQNKLFIVGDERQSIYRFRAAEVDGFIEMNRQIARVGGEKIDLKENFRSDPKLIDFFNDFFSMVFDNSSINYTNVVAGKSQSSLEHNVELWLPSKEVINRDVNATDRRKIEAELIANSIVEMVEFDESNYAYGDIAILFRALTDIKIYEAELRKRNIPYVVVGSRGFFEKQEVRDLMNLLTWLVNPQDIIALTGVLRSPLFGLSDEAFYFLQTHNALESLEACALLSDNDQSIWNKSCQLLHSWREIFSHLPISQVLEQVLVDTNYKTVLLGSANYGVQGYANIVKFVDMVSDLEHGGISGRVEVLNYLQALKDGDTKQGEAVITSEVGNAVQIMTVHQSKGLEFKAVIIPQCERDIIHPDTQMVQYTRDFGLVLRNRGWNDAPQSNCYYQKMKALEKIKDLEESFRLLYVAATRAEEKLIFSAVPIKWSSGNVTCWLDLLVSYLNIDTWPIEDYTVKQLVKIKIKQNPENIKEVPEVQGETCLPIESKINLQNPLPLKNKTDITLSASALLDYTVCPRRYYFRYIQKLPKLENLYQSNNELDSMLLGELVHHVCENAKSADSVYPLWEKALSGLDITKYQVEQYKKSGLELLDRYLESSLFKFIIAAREVRSEVPFVLYYAGYTFNGFIDKVVVDKGSVKVFDFKTGAKTSSAIAKYKLQMALYALAVSKKFQQYPQSLAIYFMQSGATHDYINDLASEKECCEVINKVIEKFSIENSKNQYSSNKQYCQSCEYSLLCYVD